MRREEYTKRRRKKRDRISAEGIDWTWQLLRPRRNIERDGENELRQLELPLFQQSPPELPPKISRSQSSRSSRLWASVRWFLIGYQETVSESEFVLWLAREIEGADFGALTLREARDAALKDLRIDDQTLIRWMIKHTAPGARFKSDGDVITLRT
jgi:hypothetical protein